MAWELKPLKQTQDSAVETVRSSYLSTQPRAWDTAGAQEITIMTTGNLIQTRDTFLSPVWDEHC